MPGRPLGVLNGEGGITLEQIKDFEDIKTCRLVLKKMGYKSKVTEVDKKTVTGHLAR